MKIDYRSDFYIIEKEAIERPTPAMLMKEQRKLIRIMRSENLR